MGRAKTLLFTSILSCLLCTAEWVFSQAEPEALLLTWRDDPTSTMVVDWHVLQSGAPDSLYYKLSGEAGWQAIYPEQRTFPHSDRNLYRVDLNGLKPDSRYNFRIGKSGREYWFETMPGEIGSKPLVFAIGGDTYDRGHEARHMWMERTNLVAMEYNPRFIVWGGDLAYADGKENQVWRWYGWFEAVKNTLIRDDGKVTPVIVCIGNHEVNMHYYQWGDAYEESDAQREQSAPFFYALFSFPGQPGYNVLDFGDYLSLVILDSDHTNPVSGAQSKWLENILAKRDRIPHVFPVYHVPAYPSAKTPLDNRTSKNVREYWTPLFDRHNIPLAFEYHDHAYKRTPRIKGGMPDPGGTIYLGDGGWGTQVRTPKDPDTTWYLDKAVRARHAVLVSLYQDQRHIRAVDEYGNIIDEYPALFERPASETKKHAALLPEGGLRISAEDASRSGPVFVESDYEGYTGEGFAWFNSEQEPAMLKWILPAEQSGNYRIRFRYSSLSDGVSPAVLVNGEKINPDLQFQNTESRAKWQESEYISIRLRSGNNTIEFQSAGSPELRIDGLEIVPDTK